MGIFSGKTGLVLGVANDRSIAWAMSEALVAEGAELGFSHLPGERSERRVRQLAEPHNAKLIMPLDVQKDEEIDAFFDKAKEIYGKIDFVIHSIAYAPTKELQNPYYMISREGWHMAMDISAYSLLATTRAALPLMPDGGSIVTLTYFGGEKVMPGYNVMGVCKAALEHTVRYLAWDLGEKNVRVNALSAGPMRTLSSAGISDFDEMREHQAQKSCLKRNVDPKELGSTGIYLLSDMSNGVTGETIHVDCGYNIVGL
ncbi:Enoyl-[acyl-carrier-protein] reductase [NADH] FabI [Planctomycetes bacterium Pan216]|uniref:Enoyl-[acyl-carrier-protein] reductase [NADH] n=1 Tax=Kolteria novifilia TaxID=2527975 RepID=A0A518BCS1_9BACT|nr:Enoyl-[acyl-carrier-protein] reductase [NADH] FabI [Planctomycetes bacterium Pan216]